ncbi:unnamed protein product [Mytilus coruscus]|uniref:Uncharacterized protein n=1 Tax=Mytilus coruscus TaxID=42192 RepID=A0A6J8DLU4_MYTCO|nr:unnamed protein product [Mytilus coruscus]
MKSLGKSKSVDLMAGSEKILRVHHRNMVHARYLQNNLNDLDNICKRNLNRVQQEIYNVYYSEFLPLRESKKMINYNGLEMRVARRGTKRFDLVGDGRVKQKCVFPNISSSACTNNSFSTPTVSRLSDVLPLPSINDQYRRKENDHKMKQKDQTIVPLSVILKLPKEERHNCIGKWKEHFERSCPSVVSRQEESSPPLNNDRLEIIKSAIALSSQPAPDIDGTKKSRKLRKSFLINLRKESIPIWNDSVLKGIKDSNKRKLSATKPHSTLSRNGSAKSVTNRLKSENVVDEIRENVVDLISGITKPPAAAVKESLREKMSQSDSKGISNSPIDESYYSETPRFFSEIDEEPSSFEDSDWSSYTSSTDSSYWEYTGDDYSETADEI